MKAGKHISIYIFLSMHCQVHKYLCSLFTIDRFFYKHMGYAKWIFNNAFERNKRKREMM